MAFEAEAFDSENGDVVAVVPDKGAFRKEAGGEWNRGGFSVVKGMEKFTFIEDPKRITSFVQEAPAGA